MKKFILTVFIMLFLPVMVSAKPVNTVNVAFTIDNNYPIYTMLAINSILHNNISSSNYHFYIIENNITEQNKNKMKKFIAQVNKKNLFDSKIDFIHIDTDTIDKGQYLFAFSNRITPIAIARIMLPNLLDVDRVIYLDGDILVTADLKDLYTLKLDGKPFGMAMNISQMGEALEKRKINMYYNSGVILMDLNKCRQTKTAERMLAYLQNNIDRFLFNSDKDKNEKFLYPDQDLINVVLNKEIKQIPQKWNNQTIAGVHMVDIGYNPDSIIHYIGPVKPWLFNKPYNRAELLYMLYWDTSEELKLYKHHLVFKKMYDDYVKIIKLKKERYVSLLKKYKIGRELFSPFDLFYVKMKVVN